MTLFLDKLMIPGNFLFTCINQLPAAVLRLKLSSIGNASEVGFTHNISWDYNSAMLKCVSSFPVCCAFSQLLACIAEFVWRWEMHRNQSIQPFSSRLLEIKALYRLCRAMCTDEKLLFIITG